MIDKLKPSLLSFFLFLLIVSGCGIIDIHEKFGQYYPYDDSIKLQRGMTQGEVVALLGKPYVVGEEQNGDILYKYEWTETHGQSFVYGLFIMGEKRTVAIKGGTAEIRFEPDAKTVKKIEYKIVGSEDYVRLRGGNDAKIK